MDQELLREVTCRVGKAGEIVVWERSWKAKQPFPNEFCGRQKGAAGTKEFANKGVSPPCMILKPQSGFRKGLCRTMHHVALKEG